jgi:hypothetical protein
MGGALLVQLRRFIILHFVVGITLYETLACYFKMMLSSCYSTCPSLGGGHKPMEGPLSMKEIIIFGTVSRQGVCLPMPGITMATDLLLLSLYVFVQQSAPPLAIT